MKELQHEPKYKVNRLMENDNCAFVFSGHENYPYRCYDDEDVFACVEGLVYNRSDLEIREALEEISESYLLGRSYEPLVRDFSGTSDGDFVVTLYYKNRQECIIFNDRWGRLPSYYYLDDSTFMFSRELRFVLEFVPEIEFDRNALCEFLVFEYTLGGKTIVKRVHKVPPSCLFVLQTRGGSPRLDKCRMVPSDISQPIPGISRKGCIETCRDLFLRSVQDRLAKMQERNYRVVSDLSGGRDTRAVFGGLCRFNSDVHFCTIDIVTGDESDIASKLASLYNRSVVRITADHNMNWRDMSWITYVTDCTVNPWTSLACFRDSLEMTKLFDDSHARWGGLGGEFIRHPYKPAGFDSDIVQMIRAGKIIRRIPVKQACAILGLNEEAFYRHLAAYFDTYQEASLDDRLKHLYLEYYSNLVNAGENRSRLHYWTVQPLWSKELLDFQMRSIPLKYINHGFFRDFLSAVDPMLLKVPFHGDPIRWHHRVLARLLLGTAGLQYLLRLGRFLRKRRTLKPIYRLAMWSWAWLSGKPVPVDSGHDWDDRSRLKNETLDNYGQLSALRGYLDEAEVARYIKEERSGNRLYELLALILYFQEVESRFAHKCVDHGLHGTEHWPD